MPPMNGTFDASQFKPNYGFDKVMPGKYLFRIANTEIVPTKDNNGGMFVITFQTPSGSIQDRYNLWNQSAKAVEIAHGQLSALCHATGIFRLNWQTEGAELRNAEGMIEVGWQKGQEPTTENPNGGYTEIKKIYDRNGNEPGKGPAAQATQTAPMQQQPNGGWGASAPNTQQQPPQPQPNAGGWQPPNQQAGQANPNTGWGASPQPNQQTAPVAAPQGGGAWQQNQQPPQTGQQGKPPWAQ